MNTPCLTESNIAIGHIFYYKECFWIRTDRFTASTPSYGACSFNRISDPEFENFTNEVKTLNQTKIQQILTKHLKELI